MILVMAGCGGGERLEATSPTVSRELEAGERFLANLRQLTFDGFPMFYPDGTKLVFASNRYGSVEGETNIFIADWVEE